jgi:hypothetical protein
MALALALALVLVMQPSSPSPVLPGAANPAGDSAFEVVITVFGDPGAVIAHVSVPGEAAARVIPMEAAGSGSWSVIVPVTPQRAIGVVFEALYPDGSDIVSGPHSLVDLGMAEAAFPEPPLLPLPAETPGEPFRLWLAVGTGAAALFLLALWVSGRRRGATAA